MAEYPNRLVCGVGLLIAVLVIIVIAVPLSLNNKNKVERDQHVKERDQLVKERDDMKMRLCESPGCHEFNRDCHCVSTEKKPWDECRRWCRDTQSDLIVIKSKEKQDFIDSFNKRVWLGLTDRATEGSFQWVDGTPLTTPTFWAPGEPHGQHSQHSNAEQDCVEFYDGSDSTSSTRGWNDVLCSNSAYCVCERAVG